MFKYFGELDFGDDCEIESKYEKELEGDRDKVYEDKTVNYNPEDVNKRLYTDNHRFSTFSRCDEESIL